ncbi:MULTISPECIES: MFS transporter [unclassified Arthrobacter]|uniref:MFS transporter n=1 Tax=unclassified Arthrobacter TaxID=235627 RepID=UPI002E06C045|nr:MULTISPECIES: MFS transporter [unclassified Arthrobacter]MEC5192775.1 CP family cyanate transporter-like MFS transporter [Arthrobacter sp. MP_M4]MEC5204258.1 CP family cyanate transporter-like MFS transporter [Arthrobacter sp. MP_M7]
MSSNVLAKVPRSWILLAAIGLIALNMRGPFVAVAPVVGLMQQELGFSPVELGLLTGIPVLCFALASPLASLTGRKLGAEVAISLTLLGVLLGVVVRSAGNGAVVMLGTVILGVAITIGNIAVPLIIRRDFAPARQGTAMGIYTATLNVGSFITAMVMAPLAALLGWRLALAACGLFAVAALLACALAFGGRAFRPDPVPAPEPAPAGVKPASRWITVGLTAGFAGQAFSYYGVTAWLPSILADTLGMTAAGAGAGSSLFQIFAIVGGLGVPLAARFASTTAVGLTLGLLWVTVPAGLLLAPGLWWLWSSLGGVAQGGGITLIFIAIIRLARDQASAGRMSAVVQGVGYSFGALAPTLLGYVNGTSGSWTGPLLMVLGSVAMFILGTALSLRHVPKPH